MVFEFPYNSIPNYDDFFNYIDRVRNKDVNISTKYGAGNQYKKNITQDTINQLKQVGNTKKDASVMKNLSNIANKGKQFVKASSDGGVPFVSGAWDTYSGINKMFNGQPFIGAGQTAFGVGEIAFSVPKLIAAARSGGKAYAPITAGEIAVRTALRQAYRNLLKKGLPKDVAREMALKEVAPKIKKLGGKNLLTNPKFNIGSTLAFEGTSGLSNLFNDSGKEEAVVKKKINEYPIPGAEKNNNQQYSGGVYGNQNVDIGQSIPNGINDIQQQSPQANVQEVTQDEEQPYSPNNETDYSKFLYDYLMQQQLMQPYRDNIQGLANDYRRYNDLTASRNLSLALLSGLTGIDNISKVIGKNTPLEGAINQASLYKTAGEDLIDVHKGYNELLGNLKALDELGLDPDIANANSNIIKLLATSRENDKKLQTRLDIQNLKFQNQLTLKKLEFDYKNALQSGNIKLAGAIKNKINITTAYRLYLEGAEDAGDINEYTATFNRNLGTNFRPPQDLEGNVGFTKRY